MTLCSLQIHLKELDEINAGVCDGATYEYIKKYMPFIHYNRKKDKLRYRYPSGESYIDLCKRVWPIVRQLKAHGGKKLIVGHQAVLRCIFGYLEGRPLKDITHLVRDYDVATCMCSVDTWWSSMTPCFHQCS